MDEEGKNYVMLTMNGQLLFESGRAELTEKGLPILSKVGDILKPQSHETSLHLY